MQWYPIVGEWKRTGQQKTPWRTWSVNRLRQGSRQDTITGFFRIEHRHLAMVAAKPDGRPDATAFATASLSLSAERELAGLLRGAIGINPAAEHPTIDLWGAGIRKLGSLTVTNEAIFNRVFA